VAIVGMCGFGTLPVAGDLVAAVSATNGVSTYSRQTGRSGGYSIRHTNSTNAAGNTYTGRLSMSVAGYTEWSLGFAMNRASGTTAFTIVDNSVTGIGWHWWNLVFRYSATVGICELYRDNVLVVRGNGDTVPTSSQTFSSVAIYVGNSNGGAQVDVADVIFKNDASQISDMAVISLFPESTSAAGLVGSDGDSVNNHLLVNENPTYDAASYVGSATVGATDTYTMADLPVSSGTVAAVQASVRAFKSDAGAKTMATIVNSTQGAAIDPGGGSTIGQVYLTDGGTAWDVARVNAATVGVKVVS
jgi:hypothetical protein